MNISGNASILREINTYIVRQILKSERLVTKQQIAEISGLSTVTVSTIIQRLLEDNEVFEADQAPSSGGRPAHQFCFNENHSHVLVLFTHEQFGQDILHLCVANLYGECVKTQSVPLDKIELNTFVPWIDAYLKEFPTIRAIGFGLPGLEVNGKIIVLDYPALVGKKLTQFYSDRYQLPVIFENDVNAAVMGYCKTIEEPSGTTVIYTYFPKKYPPGAGIYIDGKLYKGMSNYAGEFGVIPFEIDWQDLALYQNVDQYGPAISKVIIAMSGLLNPQKIILFGDFLTSETLEKIRQLCSLVLPSTAVPQLFLSDNFTDDYQRGMVSVTLEVLEPQINLFQS